MFLKDGYAQSQDLDGDYRFITAQEAKRLCAGHRVPCLDVKGNVRLATVLSVKTWKRSAGCVVSLKYDLKCFFTAGRKEMDDTEELDTILVRIS